MGRLRPSRRAASYLSLPVNHQCPPDLTDSRPPAWARGPHPCCRMASASALPTPSRHPSPPRCVRRAPGQGPAIPPPLNRGPGGPDQPHPRACLEPHRTAGHREPGPAAARGWTPRGPQPGLVCMGSRATDPGWLERQLAPPLAAQLVNWGGPLPWQRQSCCAVTSEQG